MTGPADNPPLINQPAREATASMRGYWAQIWRSVLAWLELGPTERLYLEGAEDLDRVSGLEAETIQVKDTTGNITLRSPDVIEAIDNAFGHQQRNPQRTIRFRFLTTSAVGLERGAPFRDRMPGLELWRVCRESTNATRGEADARAIADFLLAEVKVSAPVQAFLRSDSSAEIRLKLISAIEWDTAADDASQVIRAVKDGLVVLGEANGVPPESAEAVADHLYATAFATATRREERYLTRAGLLRALAEKTRVSLPAATVAALAAAIPKHLVPEGTLALTGGGRSSIIRLPPPLPARYYARTTVLTELSQRLSESAIVVLQGGTGVGKSVSAAGHVTSSTSSWGWVDLRGVAELARLLDQVEHELAAESGITHLVLDDMALPADARPLERALVAIKSTLSSRGGQLMVTSVVELPQRLALALTLPARGTLPIPSFTHDEIAAFLVARGCQPETCSQWATIIQVHTSGHAQLVHARVATLEAQGFTPPALEQLTTTPADVVEARAEAKRLIATLAPPTRELVYRLSLTPQALPQRYALAIAGQPQPIAEPGLIFAGLVGPWVERVGEGLYRISPLLSGIGQEIQGESWARAMHATVARTMLGLRTLSPDDVSHILLHATTGKDWLTVARLSFGLLTADTEIWEALALSAGWFMFVGTHNAPERPQGDPFTLFLIRTLQLRLATGAKNAEAAEAIIACANQETPPNIEGEAARLIRHQFLTQILRTDIELPIQQTLAATFEFVRLSDELGDLLDGFRKVDKILTGPTGAPDLAGLAGFSLMTHLTDRASLTTLVDACESADPALVRRLLWFIGGTESTAHLVCDRIWLSELKHPIPDWNACRGVFQRAYELGRRFNLPGLAQGAARVIARITAENLQNPAEALRLAEQMIAQIGSSPGQEDGRASILLDRQDNAGALAIWRRLLPDWKPRDEFDLQQAFSYRRAAIAAARLAEWREAAEWLHGAWELAKDNENAIYPAALLIDEGYAWWKVGNNDRTLQSLVEGMAAIERLPPDDADEGAYLLRKRAGYALQWMAHAAGGLPAGEQSAPPAFALCSGMEPVTEARLPSTPEDAMWVHLLEFEFFATRGDRLFLEYEARLSASRYGPVRFSFDRLRMRHRLRNLAFHDFVEVVGHYAEAFALCRRYYYEGSLQVFEPLPADAAAIGVPEMDTEFVLVGMLNAIFSLAARGSVTRELIDRWRASVAFAGPPPVLKSWLDFVESLFVDQALDARAEMRDASRPWTFRGAASIRYSIDDAPNPAGLLVAHDFWTNVIPMSDCQAFVLPDIELLVTRAWLTMADRPFLLRAPAATVPALQQACSSSSTNWRKIGEVLTAACDVVPTAVPTDMRNKFRDLALRP
jgi:tetratricopeptide (TPR) repeat protein